MARQVIELYTHEGELVLDPFVGSGTTLVAAQDSNRNALGFDLQEKYIKLSADRLSTQRLFGDSRQIPVQDDARNIPQYLIKDSLSLVFTSPPYANLLNRKRKNKSRRNRDNGQLGKIEQYSQDPLDLGTLEIKEYTHVMGKIFANLLPFMKAWRPTEMGEDYRGQTLKIIGGPL